MEEIEREEDWEKVLIPVRKEKKVEQKKLEKTLEPRGQWKMSRRWHTY